MYRNNYVFDEIQLINFVNVNKKDATNILEWRNHEAVRKWVYNNKPILLDDHLNFIKNLQQDNKNFYWVVKTQEEPVGVISLNKVDYNNKNAYIGLYGNMLSSIKGKGSLLMRSLIYMGFEIIKLHALKLEVFENNQVAVNLYKKFGFEEEGLMKDFVFRNNQWINVRIMGKINDREDK